MHVAFYPNYLLNVGQALSRRFDGGPQGCCVVGGVFGGGLQC